MIENIAQDEYYLTNTENTCHLNMKQFKKRVLFYSYNNHFLLYSSHRKKDVTRTKNKLNSNTMANKSFTLKQLNLKKKKNNYKIIILIK